MNIGQLRKVLKTAETHYRTDDRAEVADALSAFATNLLQGDDTKTVAAFVKEIEKARIPAISRSRGARQRRR